MTTAIVDSQIVRDFGAMKRPYLGNPGSSGLADSSSPEVMKLKKAASQFEAMLLSKWWSAMKESGIGADDDNSDPGHDTLDEMGMQAMSTAVAQGGGIGIASMLVHRLLSNMKEAGSANPEMAPPSSSNNKV